MARAGGERRPGADEPAWVLVLDAEGQVRTVGASDSVLLAGPRTEEAVGSFFWEALFSRTQTPRALADGGLEIIRVNKPYARAFGVEIEALEGRPLKEFYPGDAEAARRWVLGDKRPHSEAEAPIMLREQPEEGVSYWDCEVAPVLDHAGGVVVVLVSLRNVTDRKRAMDGLEASRHQLQALAAELALAESRERRRIARELHDNLGHALGYAVLKLDELRSDLPPGAALLAEELGVFLERAIDVSTSMTFDLSPPILYDLGLEAALEWLAERLEREHRLRVSLDMPEAPPPVGEPTAVTLFQTAHELLANTIKHAKAAHVSVRIRYEPPVIRLEVQDDGIGFDPGDVGEAGTSRSGFGLLSITQRIAYLGGAVDIASAHGQGTRVLCVAPLDTPEIGTETLEDPPSG